LAPSESAARTPQSRTSRPRPLEHSANTHSPVGWSCPSNARARPPRAFDCPARLQPQLHVNERPGDSPEIDIATPQGEPGPE
jgi:hypothetical protein